MSLHYTFVCTLVLLEDVMELYGAESFPGNIDWVCHDNVTLVRQLLVR